MQKIILTDPLTPFADASIPYGTVVAINKQNDLPTVWVSHEWKAGEGVAEGERRVTFRAFATGEVIPDGWEHLQTVFVNAFVWHVHKRAVE